MELDKRETAIVLASLRLWQSDWRHDPEKVRWLTSIATDSGAVEQMDKEEIDGLCERLNMAEEPVELSACCHATIGFDAWVDSNDGICGGPFDAHICINCCMEDPPVWDRKSPPWPRAEREGQADLPEGVEEPEGGAGNG